MMKTVAEARANRDADTERKIASTVVHIPAVLKLRSMQLEHRERHPALWKLRAHEVTYPVSHARQPLVYLGGRRSWVHFVNC
jgi:hypothetical protein